MTPNTYCSAGNRPDTLHAAAADPVFQINSFDAHFQTQKVYKKQKYDQITVKFLMKKQF